MRQDAWIEDLVLDGWRFWLEGDRLRFRAPSSQASEAMLERLRDAKPAIIRLLRDEPDALAIAPLSYGQRALWFLWRLAPASHAYNQSLALRVGAIVDEAAWKAACQALTVRHAMLRTTFPDRAGEPLQRVHTAAPLAWRTVRVPAAAGDDLATRAIAVEHERPFDLAAAPAVRFAWIDTAPESPVLLMTLHHIACDGWSIEIMRGDLERFAEAAAAGRPPGAAVRPHTYHDFVWWQRSLLASPEGDRLWEFWRSQLSPPPARLELPTDRPRPPVQTYAGGAVRFDIPANLTDRLRAIAEAGQVTPYVLFLAMFQAVLSRWTGQDDLVIGTPTAGRTLAEFASVVGYFVDPVTIRTEIDPSEPFTRLVARVRRIAHDALEHRDFPFALLVERLRVARDPGRSPLFDVTFNFLNRRAADLAERSRASTTARPVAIEQADGKFDLTLTVYEDERSMTAALGFNADLFHRATIERVAAWIRAAIDGICANPAVTIESLPLGGTALAPVLSGRRTDVASLRPVHSHIAQYARTRPGADALVAADRTLSFAGLHAACGHLAATLRRHAVTRGDAVAIVSSRSASFIVGLFSVLEAGGAFVPIDSESPPAPVRSMLARASVKVVLVERGLDRRVPAMDVPVVPIDIDTTPRPGDDQAPDVSLDDLAYIIFTSGSTGEPKGVAVSHRSLSNYVASIVEDNAIEPGRRFAFVSTVAADLGLTSIFPPIATGGTIHVLTDHAATSPTAFAAYIARHRIDYLKIVPSHLAALLAGPDARAALPVRAVFLAGESTPVSFVERLNRLQPACRIFNNYGPAETTVAVLSYAVDPLHLPGTTTLPLGRVVANTDIYLVDPQGAPVPAGMPGEVCIGGIALSRGYVGDAARTAERFVTLGNGERAYRTGDLARQLPDGTLLVLGRADRQINLNGYRIEPGQIEAVLADHPMVRQAVALPDADGDAATAIVLWVVAADGVAADRVPEDRVLADQVLADQVLADQVLAGQVLADQVAADGVLAHHRAADGRPEDHAATQRTTADVGAADGTAADGVEADGVAADGVAADRVAAERATDLAAADGVAAAGDLGAADSTGVHGVPREGVADGGAPLEGLERALRDLLASRLPRHMVPARIILLGNMPLTRNGKIDVAALRRALPAATRRTAPAREEPRDATEARVAGIWADALGLASIGVHDDFFDAGGHSLLAVRVAARVEQELGVEIPLSAFFAHRTVRAFARRLTQSDRAPSLLVPIDPRGTGAPLFCIAGAGGHLLYFHELARRLGGARPIWGLQTVWSGGRPLESIEQIAAQYVAVIREKQPQGPYFVTGHSFGALVAYEIARQLHGFGLAVGLVSLIDNAAPGIDAPPDAERDDAAWLMHIATRIGKLYRTSLGLSREDLAGGDGAERLVRRLQQAGALADIGTAQFRRFVDVYQANVRASARYRPPDSPLAVSLALFRAAEDDPELGLSRPAADPTLGWSRYSTRTVIVRGIPGTHITMLTEPHVAELAAGMNELIDRQEQHS